MTNMPAMAARRGADSAERTAVALMGLGIRSARQSAGITQSTLARALGVTQPQVSEWENGVREPTLTQLARIAHELGVSGRELAAPVLEGIPGMDAADLAPGGQIDVAAVLRALSRIVDDRGRGGDEGA